MRQIGTSTPTSPTSLQRDRGWLGATGVDPEGTTVTFAWDLDNNASFESPGQNVSMHRRGITETIQTALGEFQVVVIANTSGA